jgi:hypothetical protein
MCTVLGYYAAYIGNSLQTFQNNLLGSIFKFLTLENGTDKLSRNIGKELTLYTVYDARRVQISYNLRQKLEITVKLLFIEKARSKNCITISHITAQKHFIVEHSFHIQWHCEHFQFLIHGYCAC